MIYMRGQARDYDAWAAATGDDAWSWRNALPDFCAHQNCYRREVESEGTADYHGAAGEWRVSRQRLRWDILDAFALACEQAGFPRIDDFNRGDNAGVSYFDVNQKRGLRVSAAKAFLRPARSRANLTVWTDTLTEKLQIARDGDGHLRCTGATLRRDAGRATVSAKRELILSAGAICSPQILQLSGIGPAALLAEHGIDVVLDVPGVGANLQDHLQIRPVFKVRGVRTLNEVASTRIGRLGIGPAALLREHGIDVIRDVPAIGENLQDHLQIRPVFKVRGVRTLNEVAGTLLGRIGIALEYALRRTGPMSMAPSQLGAFVRSDPAQPHPNLQYHVQPLSLRAYDQPIDRFPAFTASVCNLNPTSRGSVRIRGADVAQPSRISPNYLSTAEDRRVAADSLRVTRRIVSQPALARYSPEEHLPGPQFTSDDELVREGGRIANTIFHPVGTVRMGAPDDRSAPLDSHLRFRGIQGLRVVDASIMPTIVSGNTNSPTLMIAEKAARWIIGGT
jgi:choline dehydrogenase